MSQDPWEGDYSDPQSLNKYAYSRNNPINLYDSNGAFWQQASSFFSGFSNAVVSNSAFGIGRQSSTNSYYSSGQMSGDVASMIQGAAEMSLGVAIGTGGTVAGVGVTVGSAGVLSPVGASVSVGSAVAGTAMVAHGASTAGAGVYNLSQSDMSKVNGGVAEPYVRPSGSTTPGQRQSVQGQPCVTCGKTGNKMYADHKTPLVEEYYQNGSINTTQMRSLDAVQPQCPTCSSRQGGILSNWSKNVKNYLGL